MERNKFKENAKSEIDKIFAQIDKLEAKKDNAKAETEEKYNKKVAELKSKKDKLQSDYNDLVNTTEGNWEATKKTFSESLEYFKNGFKELFTLFSK